MRALRSHPIPSTASTSDTPPSAGALRACPRDAAGRPAGAWSLAGPGQRPTPRATAPLRARDVGTGRLRAIAGALAATALIACAGTADAAERTLNEAWPELDVFIKINDQWRLFLLGTVSRAIETGVSTESTVGVHVDYFPAGLPRSWVDLLPGIDTYWSVWLRAGYNHIAATQPESAGEDRLLFEGTLRSVPLWGGIRLSDRNRIDLRRIGSSDSWRYRNRVRIERTFALQPLLAGAEDGWRQLLPAASAATPYATAEFFWDSRSAAWSRRYLQVGVEFDLRRDRSLDLFVGRQVDIREAGSDLTIIGAALTLRF
jgi:hypothetical protein